MSESGEQWGEFQKEFEIDGDLVVSMSLEQARKIHKRQNEAEATATRLRGLLKRCNSALEYFALAKGKYQFQELMDELAEELK